jgi:hypothetical protein
MLHFLLNPSTGLLKFGFNSFPFFHLQEENKRKIKGPEKHDDILSANKHWNRLYFCILFKKFEAWMYTFFTDTLVEIRGVTNGLDLTPKKYFIFH